MDKTSLGDRMKAYEHIERRYLTRRAPMCIRVDGVHFHSFTKDFTRPFDDSFLWCMRMTMLDLCKNIMGAKLGYTQSDEITILVTDDDTLETEPWFGKNLQKIVSVSAAMATSFFHQHMEDACTHGLETPIGNIKASEGLYKAWYINRIAIFDSRAFLVPREEVLNLFEWRQQDCIRNSIQAVGQHNFSQKELHGLSCAEIVNKLQMEKKVDWNELFPKYQRGVCARKHPEIVHGDGEKCFERMKWTIDTFIPIFHEHPEYINDLVYHKEASNGNR